MLNRYSGYQFPAEFIPKIGSQGWIGAIIELVTGLAVAARTRF